MILAQHNYHVAEDELARTLAEQKAGASIEDLGGVDIEDVPALALRFGLRAEIAELPLSAVAEHLRDDRFPSICIASPSRASRRYMR